MKKTICTSIENIETKDGKQFEVTFECKIENINKSEEYNGLEIISSKNITGIPSNKNSS